MPAVFTTTRLGALDQSLRQIAQKFFSKMPLILEPDEFIDAFVLPDHVPILKQTEEIVGMVGNTSGVGTGLASATGDNFSIYGSFAGSPPIILPQYVRHGLQPTISARVREKIESWLNERVRQGELFGDAIDALHYLNETCGDQRAVAVMLPCLPAIMGNITEDIEASTNKVARKLTEMKGFGSLPKLPREVKTRLIDASNIVLATALVTDAPDPGFKRGDTVFSVSAPDVVGYRPNIFNEARSATFI